MTSNLALKKDIICPWNVRILDTFEFSYSLGGHLSFSWCCNVNTPKATSPVVSLLSVNEAWSPEIKPTRWQTW